MKFSEDFQQNAERIEKGIGWGESYDVGRRVLKLGEKRLHIYFLTGMVDSWQLIEIVNGILAISGKHPSPKSMTICPTRIWLCLRIWRKRSLTF